jgi:hypothetical protein
MQSEMERLFKAAVDVLRESARPIHFKELCRLAIQRLSTPYTARQPWEDIREKMAMARQYGTFYVPEPECLVALQEWFSSREQPSLLNLDMNLFRQEGSARISYKIALQVNRLAGRLLTKVIDNQARENGRARGITVEEYMQEWFEQRFPKFYFRDFRNVASPTDFMLKHWNFDVASVRDDGVVGIPLDKKPVDFHVFGQICDKDVYLQGYLPGRELCGNFPIQNSKSVAPLLVWLHCEHEGINYARLKRYANYGRPAKRTREILDSQRVRA